MTKTTIATLALLCALGAGVAYTAGEGVSALSADVMTVADANGGATAPWTAGATDAVIRPSAMVYRADGHPLGAIRAVTSRDGAPISVFVRGERIDAAAIRVDGPRLVLDEGTGSPVIAARR